MILISLSDCGSIFWRQNSNFFCLFNIFLFLLGSCLGKNTPFHNRRELPNNCDLNHYLQASLLTYDYALTFVWLDELLDHCFLVSLYHLLWSVSFVLMTCYLAVLCLWDISNQVAAVCFPLHRQFFDLCPLPPACSVLYGSSDLAQKMMIGGLS